MSKKKDKTKSAEDIPVKIVGPDGEPIGVPPNEETATDIETVAADRDEIYARLQRVTADFQNFQKRMQKERAQERQFANEGLMKSLLPVVDDMERGLETARENHPADDPLLVGMQLVHDKLMQTLEQFGLTAIEAEGKPFDPERHSAMMQQPTDEAEPMTVLRVLQRGYELKGRTLRPAGVVVAQAPVDQTEDSPQNEEEL
jgi:molecular chaperone GrpE